MQPALVYAYLAMARFMRSSEIELGARGRVQALRLRAEETRWLCWSALVLVTDHTVARAAEKRKPLCLSRRLFQSMSINETGGCPILINTTATAT